MRTILAAVCFEPGTRAVTASFTRNTILQEASR